jgi:hypothetical protein
MIEMTQEEMNIVGGAKIMCTIGTSGVNCTGSLSDWAGAYEWCVGKAADGMCAASGNC